MTSNLAHLPAVHRVLALPELHDATIQHGAAMVKDAVRKTLVRARAAVVSGAVAPSAVELGREVLTLLCADRKSVV
jgi:hypothetical protein